MTRRDMLSTEKVQQNSSKAENNTFWSDPTYKRGKIVLRSTPVKEAEIIYWYLFQHIINMHLKFTTALTKLKHITIS